MKMSGSQMVWIIVTTEIVVMIGLRISPVIEISKQDAWLSMLAAAVIGAALILLAVRLSILHPNQTLVQFSQALLGKWFGRMVVLPYFIGWYLLPAFILRSFAVFIHLILLDRTPVWVIMLLLIGFITYLTYSGGIMGISRFCEIVGPLIILTLIISFLLSTDNVEWHQLLPVYFDSGWVNILKASLTPASFFADSFVLLVIVSFMRTPQKALSRSMLGAGINIFMMLTATIMVLLVFGPNLAAKLRFSYFMYVKTIDILNFIQNADIIVVFVWIFGVFAQLSLYLFVTSYELAHWFNVKDWRRIIWFGAPAIFIMGILIPNETSIQSFQKFWELVIFPVCGIGIPLLLWIITIVKRRAVKL